MFPEDRREVITRRVDRAVAVISHRLTARSALEKFAAIQMVDVKIPTTDGRELLLTRYTQQELELELLLECLHLTLPVGVAQGPPPQPSCSRPLGYTPTPSIA